MWPFYDPKVFKSVHVPVLGLRQLFVRNHFLFQPNKYLFHSCLPIPFLEQRELVCHHNAVLLVDRGDVDLGKEPNNRLFSGIIVSTGETQKVHATIKVRVLRANNTAVPLRERLVIALVKAVGDCAV